MKNYFFLFFLLLILQCKEKEIIINENLAQDSTISNSVENFSDIKNHTYEKVFVLDSLDKNATNSNIEKIDNEDLSYDRSKSKISYVAQQKEQLEKFETERLLNSVQSLSQINRGFYDGTSDIINENEELKSKINSTKPEYNKDLTNPNHNPEIIDVKTYEKSNGTVVDGHIRTKANNTTTDNLRFK